MNGNFVVASGEQLAAFFSETHGVVCSAYTVKDISITQPTLAFGQHGHTYTQYVSGPPTAEITILGADPRITTLSELGICRPANELSVDELMKIVYQKLEQRSND